VQAAAGRVAFTHDYDGTGRLHQLFASTSATKPGVPDVTWLYGRRAPCSSGRSSADPHAVPMRYTIREQLERIGDPATRTYPFSARYAWHRNGTVAESEFYSAGAPAAAKRYRYVFGAASWDALNRLKSADYSAWSGAAWTSTTAHDLASIGYNAADNLTTFQRYRQTATLIDNLSYTIPGGSNRMMASRRTTATTAAAGASRSGSATAAPTSASRTARPRSPSSCSTPPAPRPAIEGRTLPRGNPHVPQTSARGITGRAHRSG
jgi:hypothetical protein